MSTITLCLVLAAGLSAEIMPQQPNTGYATELKLLAQQRDKALADAAAPVLRRYKEALQLLQKKVTQAGDLETAMKIKEELAKMGEAAPNSEVSAEGTAAIFIGKKWGWFSGIDPDYSRHGILEFQANGVLIKQGEVGSFIDKWEALPNRIIKVKHNNGTAWIFQYDPAKNEAHSLKEKGSLDDHKMLKPVE